MPKQRRWPMIGIAATLILLVGGVAYLIAHGQSAARHRSEAELARRAEVAARLTAGGLASSTSQIGVQFDVPVNQLPKALTQWESVGSADVRAVIFDAHGKQLAGYPLARAKTPLPAVPSDLLNRAINGESVMSDVVQWGPRHDPYVWLISPFRTPTGRRVYAALSSASPLSDFARPYLRSAPAVPGAHAYLMDGNGLVIGSASTLKQGSRIPDAGLAAAAASGRSGSIGPRFWVAARVGLGTRWRVVFSVRRDTLLAAAESSNNLAWALFAAFVLTLIAFVAVAVSWARRSNQLGVLQERERAARELAHERLHDALTTLPNRTLFLDVAAAALARAAETGRTVAVLFTDIDHFKRINDSLGHAAGDELLALLAKRLRNTIRPGDTVSRFGGDEFLVLCDDLDGEEQAVQIANRITQAVADPFIVGDRRVHISCGVGVAVQSGPTLTDAAALVRDADAAMYFAKRTGEGRVRLCDATLHEEAMIRLDTEAALREAVSNDELRVHYQPIVGLPHARVRGAEALARWHRPGVGDVPPDQFISLAEECGLINELGDRVLTIAMANAAEWHAAELIADDFLLSVNISPRQLANPEFAAKVAAMLSTWPLDPSSLWLEITESAVVGDGHAEADIEGSLEQLAALGVQLAIDDFGVGLSSLHKLVKSHHVKVLKLDRSFVTEMSKSRERTVVAAVAPMAAGLGLKAVAEGVEDADQMAELIRIGYPLAQGYHFGRPISATAFEATCLEVDSVPRLVQVRG